MWSTYRNTFFTEDRRAERGSVTLPFLLLSVALGSAALGTLSIGLLWRSKVALQLRLDRCVEDAAKELTTVQSKIESSNERMRIERAAAIAAAGPSFGQSLNAVKPALAAEAINQEALRIRWAVRQARWITKRGCDGKGDLFLPLPNLRWERPPPDSIGPLPLTWKAEGKDLEIRIWKKNRFAQAAVERKRKGITHAWKAKWIQRRIPLE
jgi:hypothetical protein